MDLVSACALRVAKVNWQPRHGSFAFTVVCKATFELQPEVSPLAGAQEPVVPADVYAGEHGGIALSSDLVPFKKRPEVLVVGHAFAPGGRPVPSLVARLAVGDINKAIQVEGDRYFDAGGRLGTPEHFARMPLVWERAAGGPGTSNPAGRSLGSGARADICGRIPAPNLLPAGLRLMSRNDLVPPVGFGPIAPLWPPRAARLQRHAAWWDPGRWHERPLPADIDLDYFNAAPPDQQRSLPFGEEAIYLEHLHPRFAHLSTRLAPVKPAATVDHGSSQEPLQLRCDTLVIDTVRGLAMLVWRAHVVLDRPDRPGLVVVTGPGAPEAAPHGWPDDASRMEDTLIPDAVASSSLVLPFSGTAAPGPPSAPLPPKEIAAAPAPAAAEVERAAPPSLDAAALPFAEQALDETRTAGLVWRGEVLPFAASQGESAPRPAPASVSGLPFAPSLADARRDDPPAQPRSDPPDPMPSQRPDAPLEARWAPRSVPPPAPALQPPPPLLGASAPASGRPAGARDTGRPPVAEPGATGDQEPAVTPAPDIAFDVYPPGRCGAIAARLACDAGSTDDLLRAEELDLARWLRVHEHWLGRIRDEAARGRKKLLSDYDRAYVDALEAKRGPIALDGYARLAEAAERGAVTGALGESGLPEGAWPHIHRVWIQRIVEDVRLGKQVRAAIEALRADG
ncbi:DUF2169 domain-containing protein [Sorangium sp. So ce269]